MDPSAWPEWGFGKWQLSCCTVGDSKAVSKSRFYCFLGMGRPTDQEIAATEKVVRYSRRRRERREPMGKNCHCGFLRKEQVRQISSLDR